MLFSRKTQFLRLLLYTYILGTLFRPILGLDEIKLQKLLNAKAQVSSSGRLSHRVSEYDPVTDVLVQFQYEAKYINDLHEIEELLEKGQLNITNCSRNLETLEVSINIEIFGNKTNFDALMSKYIYPGSILLIPQHQKCASIDGEMGAPITERVVDISKIDHRDDKTEISVKTIPATFYECFEDAAFEYYNGPSSQFQTSRDNYWKNYSKPSTSMKKDLDDSNITSWYGLDTPDHEEQYADENIERGTLATYCDYHNECGSNEYCYNSAYGSAWDECESCSSPSYPCTSSNSYNGQCPSKCNGDTAAGGECSFHSTCASGYYCFNSVGVGGDCRSCTSSTKCSSSNSIDGSCPTGCEDNSCSSHSGCGSNEYCYDGSGSNNYCWSCSSSSYPCYYTTSYNGKCPSTCDGDTAAGGYCSFHSTCASGNYCSKGNIYNTCVSCSSSDYPCATYTVDGSCTACGITDVDNTFILDIRAKNKFCGDVFSGFDTSSNCYYGGESPGLEYGFVAGNTYTIQISGIAQNGVAEISLWEEDVGLDDECKSFTNSFYLQAGQTMEYTFTVPNNIMDLCGDGVSFGEYYVYVESGTEKGQTDNFRILKFTGEVGNSPNTRQPFPSNPYVKCVDPSCDIKVECTDCKFTSRTPIHIMSKSSQLNPMEELYIWSTPEAEIDINIKLSVDVEYSGSHSSYVLSKTCISPLCVGGSIGSITLNLGFMTDLQFYGNYIFEAKMEYILSKKYKISSSGTNAYFHNGVIDRYGYNGGQGSGVWTVVETSNGLQDVNEFTAQIDFETHVGFTIAFYLGAFAGVTVGDGLESLADNGAAAVLYAEAQLGVVFQASYDSDTFNPVPSSSCPYCHELCLSSNNASPYQLQMKYGYESKVNVKGYFALKSSWASFAEVGPHTKDILTQALETTYLGQMCYLPADGISSATTLSSSATTLTGLLGLISASTVAFMLV